MTENPVTSWIEEPPFGLDRKEKQARLLQSLQFLTSHHYLHCPEYRSVLDRAFHGSSSCSFSRIEDAPFLPVSMFKQFALKSISQDRVFKVLKSSGTTGQELSQVFLDKETAQVQGRVLVKIAQEFIGKQRRPMIILDHEGVIRDRSSFSARGAGILGMSQFGKEHFYAFREDMSLNVEGLKNYLAKWGHRDVLFFGFTFMVWQHFVQELSKKRLGLKLENSVLVHSGGWKKLSDLAVSPEEFRRTVQRLTGVSKVVNFYGMVEQVGSIFFENSLGYLQAPMFSDVLIRDSQTLEVLPHGKPGLVQVVSMLPKSYPGHSILTEDIGIVHGEDSESTGMKGKYFEIVGRVPKAELRGCSDTYASAQPQGAGR